MRPGTPFVLLLLACLPTAAQPVDVRPTRETEPALGGGQSVQGAALWRHPTEPGDSLLLVADAFTGLLSYRLDGALLELVPEGSMLGVDVQEDFPLGDLRQPFVMVANGTLQGLSAYTVDPATLRLQRAALAPIRVPGFVPSSVALYVSPTTGRPHAFAGNAQGTLHQIELLPQADGGLESTVVRSFDVGRAVVGLAVDDALGTLFVAEQGVGIWRYGAEPGTGETRTLVEGIEGGALSSPLGGLGLYTAPGRRGYLLAVSGGADAVAVFQRAPPHAPLGRFRLVAEGSIDAVRAPRHVVVGHRALGALFPLGLVAVHDGTNDGSENFKLVPWPRVASAFSPPLVVDTGSSPPPDGGTDGGTSDAGRNNIIFVPGVVSGSAPRDEDGDGGCHCSATSVPGAMLIALAGILLCSRRRRGVGQR